MSINLTLLGQAISLFIFVWFCMKYVWPPIINALHERDKRIADGLAAAAAGQNKLVEADQRLSDLVDEGNSMPMRSSPRHKNAGTRYWKRQNTWPGRKANDWLKRPMPRLNGNVHRPGTSYDRRWLYWHWPAPNGSSCAKSTKMRMTKYWPG